MEQGEVKIILAFKQRDAAAFAYIFKMHRKALVYFAEKILGVREEAEDIVAESFMKLWEKHADFERLSQIKSFLYVVTRNSCLNFLKYSKRVSASQKEFSYWADDKEEEILHIMYRAELLFELNNEIEILPGKMKEVFELSFFHELSSGEIASKLGLSVKTVRNQKAKAVRIIRSAFLRRNLAIALMV